MIKINYKISYYADECTHEEWVWNEIYGTKAISASWKELKEGTPLKVGIKDQRVYL